MHVAQAWRLKGQRYALKGVQCEKCQKAIFPPREVCPYCASKTVAYDLEQPQVISLPEVNSLPRAAR